MTSHADGLDAGFGVVIPRAELVVRATKSGGPGGQHVNTSSTRIELTWSVTTSRALTDAQRARLTEKLASRLDASGTLRLVSAETRSQAQNRALAEERLRALVALALVPPRIRRTTSKPRSADRARLEAKRRAGDKKRQRRTRGDDD